jgi:hypothetical protein
LRIEKTASGEPALRMIMREEAEEGALPGPPALLPRLRRQATPRPAKQQPSAPLPLFPVHLADETISRVRRDFPGWDVYALKAEFDAWIADSDDRRPNDYQSAFCVSVWSPRPC